ncbi:nucleoporin NUP35 isoform X1 [Electrophorus electricus]|uniref:nucleoporin NUP35 isoform X1 n=1 Tax=Electrophorus electricus TaxID=8005 RepID=UPI000F0A05C7|nr:nucleoporin NUP35 isoform X1 [Electrophorus electricus]
MDLQGWSAVLGIEPMSLGSPTSPKPGSGAQFLPGFLLGDLPAPATPQPRTFGLTGGGVELRSPLLAGGSPPQPVVPTPKDKSGAPPVRSIYEDVSNSSGLGMSPLTSRKQPFSVLQTPSVSAAPGSIPSMFSPAGLGQQRKCTLSPAQVDPFFTQGDALSSDDQLDETWVTVFGFPPASASYMLLQFAQYGNILKHVMSNAGNWMHIQYQSKLQARKALSKDGKVFGEAIMIGVKPCIDKNVMEGSEKGGGCSSGVGVLSTPPVRAVCTPTHAGSTPRAAMRPLSASYKTSSSEYQVISDRDTPRKDDTFVSKAMEYMFGW